MLSRVISEQIFYRHIWGFLFFNGPLFLYNYISDLIFAEPVYHGAGEDMQAGAVASCSEDV